MSQKLEYLQPHTSSMQNTITSMTERVFELMLDNISGTFELNYERAIIIPKKKVSPEALRNFTSEIYKSTPRLNDISDEELVKIIEKSSDEAED